MARTENRDARQFVVCEREYYLNELFEVQQKLPFLVYIRDGYKGNSEVETVAAGQFIFIRGVTHQTRVIAKDKTGRFQNNLLSLPMTLQMDFQVTGKKDKKGAKRLGELIAKDKFPVHVEMCGSEDCKFVVGERSAYTSEFKLILTASFTERYYIANYFFDDTRHLDLHTIPLPLYLPKVKLSLVHGFQGGTDSKWEDFLQSLETEAHYANEDVKQFGNNDIAILPPSAKCTSDAVYANIEPSAYMSLVETNTNQPTYEKIVKTFTDVEIETFEEQGKGSKPPPVPKRSYQATKTIPSVKETLKIPPPVSKKPGKIIAPKNISAIKKKAKNPPASSKPDKFQIAKGLNTIKEAVPTDGTNMDNWGETALLYSEPTENVYEELPTFGSEQLANHMLQNSQSIKNIQNSTRPFFQNTPNYENSKPVFSLSSRSCSVNNEKTLPSASQMTVDDVGKILTRLGLGKFVQVFQAQMIDGPLLMDLDNDILTDFGFKKIEILKLMKYIKSGHIPVQSNEYSSA